MLLAHLGVAVFIVGVTLVKGYEIERDVRLDVGDRASTSAAIRSRSAASRRGAGPNYDATVATIDVARNGKTVATLHPEKRVYRRRGQADDRGGDRRGFSATSTSRSASR